MLKGGGDELQLSRRKLSKLFKDSSSLKKEKRERRNSFLPFSSSLAKDIRGREEKRDEYKDEKKKTLKWSTTNEKKKKKNREYERGKQILEHRGRIRRLTKGRSLDVDAYQQTDRQDTQTRSCEPCHYGCSSFRCSAYAPKPS